MHCSAARPGNPRSDHVAVREVVTDRRSVTFPFGRPLAELSPLTWSMHTRPPSPGTTLELINGP